MAVPASADFDVTVDGVGIVIYDRNVVGKKCTRITVIRQVPSTQLMRISVQPIHKEGEFAFFAGLDSTKEYMAIFEADEIEKVTLQTFSVAVDITFFISNNG